MTDPQSISPAFKKHLENTKDADVHVFWDSDHRDDRVRTYAMRRDSLKALAAGGTRAMFIELPQKYNDVLDTFNNGKISPSQLRVNLRAAFKKDGYLRAVFDGEGKESLSPEKTDEFAAQLAEAAGHARKAGIRLLAADVMDSMVDGKFDIIKRMQNDVNSSALVNDYLAKHPGEKVAVVFGQVHGATRKPGTMKIPLPQDVQERLNNTPGSYAALKAAYGATVSRGVLSIPDNGGIDDGLRKDAGGRPRKITETTMTKDGVSPLKPSMMNAETAIFDVSKGSFTRGGPPTETPALKKDRPPRHLAPVAP